MRLILTADWHLTNRPIDEYRWSIFDAVSAAAIKHNVDAIVNLGDLTHFKDNHNALMVNRVFREMKKLAAAAPVWILQGNHDYVDQTNAFFKVLSSLEGVCWVSQYEFHPGLVKAGGYKMLFLPHSYDPVTTWENEQIQEALDKASLVFIHQPIEGASSGGHSIESPLKPSYFRDRTKAQVFAGDIHDPQKLGPVEYVGSPHPVDFGDEYETRFLLWEDGIVTPIKHKTINRRVARIKCFEDLMNYDLYKGDQLKVIYELSRSEFDTWRERKDEVENICREIGIELYGIELRSTTRNRIQLTSGTQTTQVNDSSQIVKDFGSSASIEEKYIQTGLEIIQ